MTSQITKIDDDRRERPLQQLLHPETATCALNQFKMSDKEPEKPKDAALSIPKIPSVSNMKASLKTSIKSGVENANNFLASLEERADKYGQPVVASIHDIQHSGVVVAYKATQCYEKRKQYAPEIIGGSALVVGSLVGLRRGRIPAVATAAATGFLAYVGVYEIDLRRIPDVIFGKEDK